jgi:sugar-specific transcriptional regulator TrmB
VSIDTAVRVLNKEFESHFETMEQTLRRMEPLYKEPQQSVWALTNYEQVTERVIELVNDATDEIVLIVLDEALLDRRSSHPSKRPASAASPSTSAPTRRPSGRSSRPPSSTPRYSPPT